MPATSPQGPHRRSWRAHAQPEERRPDAAARSLIVMTGVSGSGKSSLAFDTIYAEGQRRYVESLSAYARQFLERMEKPDVDAIEGICPAIAIRQKNSIRNPRSTVGTTTEIHDYLRLLYARIGRTICRAVRPRSGARDRRSRRARRSARCRPARGCSSASTCRSSPPRRWRGCRTRSPTTRRRATATVGRQRRAAAGAARSRRPGRRDARRAAPQGIRPAVRRRPDASRSRTSIPPRSRTAPRCR